MNKILEHFKSITAIPRCSYDCAQMKAYIKVFALAQHFSVHEDEFGNILCQKGNPAICLQAHYDMVCIGDTSKIELVQDKHILKAKNSTLGADNGMGMAIMFACMEEYEHLECLFTSDEEVGLIGASGFKMPLTSSCLLNLDSEEEGEICIGCAGGVDVIATLKLDFLPLLSTEKIYEISACDFPGGHSGVDIDKKIPSAIKILARELGKHDVKLISIEGGERRNSIPKSATAIVACSEAIKLFDKSLHVKELEAFTCKEFIASSDMIIKTLNAFAQGVREWETSLGIPSMSINLGVLSEENGVLRIDCAARAMDDESLDILCDETRYFFKALGFTVKSEGRHGAWTPHIGAFARKVQEIMQQEYKEVPFQAIHAGLECGVLCASQDKQIEAVSIGPTIRYPHSLREECDLDSVGRMAHIVKEIIKG
ncbi:MAG: Xaa-His dipeptidase [Campylobacteraceae bacterium]|nr:Xaa-His dipeptidase [Campylobacteraceae bacterium]